MSAPIRYRIPTALAAMEAERHHVIEASAGTGKTFLIEHRVVDLVLAGAPIDELLVVTFTEKATAELRARVRALLDRVRRADADTADDGEPCWTVDDLARQRLSDALFAFDRAPIFTIHGFCQRILTENAFANRRLFDQTQVASETAFAAAFRAELRERFARLPDELAYLEAWLGDKRDLGALQKLLYKCSEQHGRLVPELDEAALIAAIDRAAEHGIPEEEVDRAVKATKLRANSAKAMRLRLDAIRELLADWTEHRSTARFLAGWDLIKDRDKYLATLADLAAASPSVAEASQRLAAVASAAVPLDAAVAHRFLPPIQRRLARDKDRRGEFDFHDMLRLVWEALDAPDGDRLAARLRARYPHALIDEFQDTDELQWKIFRRLYLESDDPVWLSIVGDPKQAIYSFRGADVFTYLAAAGEMEDRGARPTPLTDNYRSTARLVDAYNLLFENRDGEPFFGGGIRYDQPVRAASDVRAIDAAGREVAPIELARIETDSKLSADQLRAGHLRHIVATIAGLLRDPERQIRIGPPGQERAADAGDIYVLTRSLDESEQVAAALRRIGVPCALYKQEGLFHTAEASELRDLLTGIAEPRSRSARFRAWQTRFFAPPLADLPGLGELPDTHPLVARLYDWKALADRLAYEELFARIIADSGLIERELLIEPSERALTNFLHLFELLLEEVTSSRCELHELILRLQHWIDDFETNSADERNIQRLESEPGAVQIMTVHKSKGLQAGLVFLYGGFGATPTGELTIYHRDNQRLVHVGSRPEGIDSEDEWENQRLCYVAITRAVGRLYLPEVDYDGCKNLRPGMVKQVQERLAQLAASGEPRFADGFDRIAIEPAPIERAAPSAPASGQPWRPPPELLTDPPDAADYRAIAWARAGHDVTSYSRLKRRADAAPIEADDSRGGVDSAAVELPEHQLPGGAATGIFLHEVLERLPMASLAGDPDFDSWSAEPAIRELFSRSLLRHGGDPRHLAHAQELVFDAVTAPLALGDQTVRLPDCDRLLREVEFLYPAPGGRTFVKGFIDLVFRAGDLAYVLDWKSDILPDYSAAAVARHVDAHYRLQAELYALALAKMLGVTDDASHERSFGGVVYLFLRGNRPGRAGSAIHFERPSWRTLEQVARRLQQLQEVA